jgi:hypothetical protein
VFPRMRCRDSRAPAVIDDSTASTKGGRYGWVFDDADEANG